MAVCIHLVLQLDCFIDCLYYDFAEVTGLTALTTINEGLIAALVISNLSFILWQIFSLKLATDRA